MIATKKAKKKINVVGLYSGGGGLDLGFAIAGFNIAYTTDNDPYSCATLIENQGKKDYFSKHPVVCEDISKIHAKDILKASGLKKKDIDVVIGGPPCQSFSVFGRRGGLNDPRGNLIWEYARVVNELSPKVFLFENVPGLKSIDEGRVFLDLLKVLSFKGRYRIDTYTYQVADYGVPQFRERVIIIGNRLSKILPRLETTHGPENGLGQVGHKPYRTVSEAFSGLPKLNAGNLLNAHVGRVHSQRIINRYKSLEFGDRDPKTRINKLDPNKPSYAIIVGSDQGGGKGHIHPFIPREVTPRESARLQTFPDWWEFSGSGRHLIRQIGNAVPVLFAAQIAGHIRENIFNAGKALSYEQIISKGSLDYLKK